MFPPSQKEVTYSAEDMEKLKKAFEKKDKEEKEEPEEVKKAWAIQGSGDPVSGIVGRCQD